jgi:hypothetical protein
VLFWHNWKSKQEPVPHFFMFAQSIKVAGNISGTS